MQTVNDFMETDLGNISPNPRGDYRGTATYEYLDLVVYQGGSYLCVAELGSTVTGVAPVPGKVTAEWQTLTLPGDLTSEYVNMHDTVVNKSEQVAADRQTVEESLRNVQSIQLDVEQLHQDTRTAAEEAENSKDSAAGYAQAADTSQQAAATSEANVNAQVTGFDGHVADKTADAETAITQARQRAVQVVEDATKPSLAAKTAAETAQVKAEAAQTAAETARTDAQSAKAAAETARTGAETARAGAETAQVKAETAQASTEQTAAEIAADREQIHTNRDNVAQLQRNSAGAITRSAEGSFITLEDAADGMGFRRLEVPGMTEQDGTPSPEAEVPLKNVGVLNEDGKYEVKIRECGKNIAEFKALTATKRYIGVLYGEAHLTPNTSYCISGSATAGNAYYLNEKLFTHVAFTVDSNGHFAVIATTVSDVSINNASQYTPGYGWMLIKNNKENAAHNFSELQMEIGNVATEYFPHRGHTATITSDRPLTKCDKLTCRDGVWGWRYNSGTTVYDGSDDESWELQSINGNGIANFQITLNGAVSNFDSPNMCSHFTHQTEAIANVTQPGFLISNSTGKSILYIRIPSTTASTVEAFKAWLAEHPITVQYQTDTETWVSLSAEEQAAMNALCTYAGTTHIWTDDPLQPVISVDYTLDTEGYIRNVVVKNLQLDIAEQITDLQAQIDQLTINNNL